MIVQTPNDWRFHGNHFGTLTSGANYWASHAGTAMWHDWQPDTVEADFKSLAGHGIEMLRVFPLWSDFQPISVMRQAHGNKVECRWGEESLERDDGLSPEMLERFRIMLDSAEKYGLKLIVGLMTGWMSGRLFIPPALENLNLITDPVALMWEVRYIRGMVETFRDHPAIIAWDLGNECNCLGHANHEQTWIWAATIAASIRAADSTRPVISGMHNSPCIPDKPWSIRNQGELTDILTIHPYPIFTRHCAREPLNTMRPLLHSAAELSLYADLSGKPVIVEEFGSLGPMICNNDVAAQLARVTTIDAWAHGAGAALWWCAYDQTHLDKAPYDWDAVERELGLFTRQRVPKPQAKELLQASRWIDSVELPTGNLPPRKTEAVCLITPGPDTWAVAYSAFILAKQAGFDLHFHYCDRPIPSASLYLLPSISNRSALTRQREQELWEAVQDGAVLYQSMAFVGLAQNNAHAGFELVHFNERTDSCTFCYEGESYEVNAPSRFKLNLNPGTKVLGEEDDGSPLFVQSPCGKGVVFSLLFPLELFLATNNEAFLPEKAPDYWRIYAQFAAPFVQQRAIRKACPWLGVTEHPLPNGDILAVLTNYQNTPLDEVLQVADDWECPNADNQLHLDACSSTVWTLSAKIPSTSNAPTGQNMSKSYQQSVENTASEVE